jgi:hypothetical protein
MDIDNILESIDQQILKLQQARSLLTDGIVPAVSSAPAGKRRGRPKGSVKKTTAAPAKVSAKVSKRTMSEEGKQRIAAAQKVRWAAQKKSVKAAAKKAAAKKASPAKKSARKTVAKPEAVTAEA